MKVDILFRSCSRVYSVHQGPTERFRGPWEKSEIIVRCLRSLMRSAELALDRMPSLSLTLTVFDDDSDTEALDAIRGVLASSRFATDLIHLPHRGNGSSLKACFEHARERCDQWIYLVEDDYLHSPEAIGSMLSFASGAREATGGELVVHPFDDPARYAQPYPSLLVLGGERYWRTIRHTTGTFLFSRATLERFWPNYMALTRYGEPGVTEDTTINPIYEQIPCFSPMPSLAQHLAGPGSAAPFVDWQPWWEAR